MKRRTTYEHVCRLCSNLFVTRVKTQPYCSRRCSGIASHAGARSSCVVCGGDVLTRRPTCSRPCYVWSIKHPGIKPPTRCGHCARPFAGVKTGQKFCSRACAHAATEARRRARRGNAPCELILPVEIFERDGWWCYLCGQDIDPDLRQGPRMASLDHIIPVAHIEYPGHIRDNVAAAHLGCNARKRDLLV